MRTSAWLTVSACVVAAATSALAADTQVTSKNAVGYVKVEVPSNAMTIVAAPFNSMDGKEYYTLDELVGTNMTANVDPSLADQVYVWTGSKYEIAYLNADGGWGGAHTYWKWCYVSNGINQLCASNALYDIQSGQGFWIQNNNQSKELYFLGEVPLAETSTNQVDGLLMLANPYPVSRNLDQLITTNDGAFASIDPSLADQIFVWSGGKYQIAFLNADGGWGGAHTYWRWCYLTNGINIPCASNTTFDINPGMGFWYKPQGGSFTWKYDRPYNF